LLHLGSFLSQNHEFPDTALYDFRGRLALGGIAGAIENQKRRAEMENLRSLRIVGAEQIITALRQR